MTIKELTKNEVNKAILSLEQKIKISSPQSTNSGSNINIKATVDSSSGKPSVTVSESGNENKRSFLFSFRGLKGESGESYDKTQLLNMIYPIGSIYMSVNNVSPQSFLGGIWEQLKDRFLLGAGNTYSAGSTGGAASVTLSVNQIPLHSHTINHTHATGSTANNTIMATSGTSYKYNGVGNQTFGASSRDVSVPAYNGSSGSAGGSQSHNNMPPYLTVYMWKRTS